jgi:hypothetical protein
MQIKSKFDGYCKKCHGIIKKGSSCNWSSSFGARHLKCKGKKK